MRTIGKKNLKEVRKLTEKALDNDLTGVQLRDFVMAELDEEVFDLWEGAYNEIEQTILDEILNGKHKEKYW